MARYNKIYAGPVQENLPQVVEKLTSAAILPGTIVADDGNGEWEPHGTAGGRGAYYVLQDNYLAMSGTATAVPDGDVGIGIIPMDEQLYRALVVTGSDVTEGDPLSSNGSGVLRIAGATSGDEVLFFAAETYNNNTGSSQLILVRKGAGAMPTA